MTPAQLRNLGLYALYGVVGALIAAGVKLGVELNGADPVAWREVAATFVNTLFGTLSTATFTAMLTRVGSEEIAGQVNALRSEGVHRDEMIVMQQGDGIEVLAGQIQAMTPDGKRKLLAIIDPQLSREAGG